MNEIDTLLVIGLKFNDVFYAMSTSEWHHAEHRILAVIAARRDFALQFHHMEGFDDTVVIDFERNDIGRFKTCLQIKRYSKRLQCDTVMLSNPLLVITQYLIKVSRAREVICLEDGTLNYHTLHPSLSLIKPFVQRMLGLNERKLFNSVSRTYLLIPEMAKFYNGEPVRLQLSPELLSERITVDIRNKKIFVGQVPYHFGQMTLEAYCERVNKFVKKYNIDYYLPHAFADSGEQVDCPILDIEKLRITLEILALQYDFVIYSFGSSVLYSTRIINPRIKTYMVRISELSKIPALPLLEKYCSGTVDF